MDAKKLEWLKSNGWTPELQNDFQIIEKDNQIVLFKIIAVLNLNPKTQKIK